MVDAQLETDVGQVVIYDDRIENLSEALRDRRCSVFPHGGDILHADVLRRAMEGVDGVFHFAALWLLHCHEYSRSAFEVNVQGTFGRAAGKSSDRKPNRLW